MWVQIFEMVLIINDFKWRQVLARELAHVVSRNEQLLSRKKINDIFSKPLQSRALQLLVFLERSQTKNSNSK